jgi:HAE1 family hydrophobic/amphiphilic exporter-1
MLSRFFIARPVLANVLAALTVLVGLFAMLRLPVAQYPNVVPPTVQVTTRYPGASPADVMRSVGLPIEQQVNGVQSMIYMQSTSAADGSYALTVTFAIGTDLDQAQVLVQNRVQAVIASLPQAVQAQGVSVQKRSTAILQIIALTSADLRHDSLYLSNYAIINMRDVLTRVPGVGSINVFGAGQYAMRIWLDPERLRARGLTVQDVTQNLQQQNMDVTAGQFGMPPAPEDQARQYTLVVAGRLTEPGEFENVILKAGSGGAVTRLRDVGRVELGAQSYGQAFALNGRPAAGLAIFQSPDANALAVATAVRASLDELQLRFPVGVTASVPFDSTVFVRASVREVYVTLVEAAVLVLVVIVLFLQDWRAMLVPATTVPVTIIGAFAAMAAFGFSINLATLFAIVLAVGIVVDDAIVVVERAAYHISRGADRVEAAARALDELFGPIIGITLVLMAVFVPASFLPGLSGRLYAQFALVIAATAAISAVNAATLKPVQCATWLRPHSPGHRPGLIFRWFNRGHAAVESLYVGAASRAARHAGIAAGAGMLLVAASIFGFARIPTSFLPLEDQGYLLVAVQLPPGAALGRTEQVLQRVQEKARALPFVREVIGIAGVSPLESNASLSSSGVAYVMLKDWSQRSGRDADLRSLYDRTGDSVRDIEGARTLVIVPPAIQGLGNVGGFTVMVELRDGSTDFAKLQRMTRALVENAATQSSLQHVGTSYRAAVPQLRVVVDRTKTETFHVSVGDVFNALGGYIGSSYVNQFNKFGRTFQVYVQADAKYRLRPRDLDNLYVRSSDGNMVPLGALVRVEPMAGPALVTMYNLYPAATIVGLPAPGFSSGEAISLMEEIAADTLPRGAGFNWTAMSYQEKLVGGQIYYVFGLALVLVYLCLAGQYESWVTPFAVILSVPLSLIGPALVFGALGLPNNLYTQIGLLLLIALSAKNAILIAEVAREHRAAGEPIIDAAVNAARIRFRPIVMTSFAFILGVLPLVLSSGAGAAARISLGFTVFSGMLANTCLAVVFVPAFFVVLQHLQERVRPARPAPQPAE